MKKSLCFAAGLLALNLAPVLAQPVANPPQQFPAPPPSSTFSERLAAIQARAAADQANAPVLTKFNLDFPGGTPKELVAAIEKAMGKPLNAIIPDENADTKIPALKMSNVDVPHLFNAVVSMSYKYASPSQFGGFGQPRDVVSSYGFETKDGNMSDDSIWYFIVYKAPTQQAPPPPQKICQFYSLSPYLDRGFTVDDITTAIQTGWKMAGVTPTPELNYHKETKLLIAYGEPGKLNTIQTVLGSLPSQSISYNQINVMRNDISQLKTQVEILDKRRQEAELLLNRLSSQTSVPVATPAEKSGK